MPLDSQLIAQMGTQLAALGRSLNAVGKVVKEQKDRIEMLSRMLSMHHFAIVAIVDATSPELREQITEIAKRFKIKLRPTDPEYPP